MPPKADINRAGTEHSDDMPRSKENLGSECKVCTRPFTVFRWQPGGGARFKKTEVCQLDLQYALPTQIRDMALGRPSKAPTSNINREYYAQNLEGKLDQIQSGSGFHDVDNKGKDLLRKLARQDPYYHRNRPKLCSFYAKGQCDRGDACPYRHELPVDRGDLSKQNLQDRYHGVNDPVARSILSSHSAEAGLATPSDTSITSLFLSNLPTGTDENAIRAALPDALRSTKDMSAGLKSIVITTNCAFLNFANRAAAESAANAIVLRAGGPRLEIGGQMARVVWGRPKKARGAATASGSGAKPIASGSGAKAAAA